MTTATPTRRSAVEQRARAFLEQARGLSSSVTPAQFEALVRVETELTVRQMRACGQVVLDPHWHRCPSCTGEFDCECLEVPPDTEHECPICRHEEPA